MGLGLALVAMLAETWEPFSMVTAVDAAAYADLVELMPWLDRVQPVLKLRSPWDVSVLDLVVVDLAIAPAAVWAVDGEYSGLVNKLAELQDCVRHVLRVQGLAYPGAG